jgi:sulfate adenylyltransferase subunit 2
MTATPTDYDTLHVDELRLLEAEAVHIIREVAAELERPVLLFSAGKDSIVLLRLAEKAFRPSPLPFPVMHVDTGHNFDDVIEFRDRRVEGVGHKLIVASVQEPSTAVGCPIPVPALRATGNRPARCWMRWRPADSTRHSAAPAATRNGPAPRNAS